MRSCSISIHVWVISLGPSMFLWITGFPSSLFFFFNGWLRFYFIYVPNFLYPFMHQQTQIWTIHNTLHTLVFLPYSHSTIKHFFLFKANLKPFTSHQRETSNCLDATSQITGYYYFSPYFCFCFYFMKQLEKPGGLPFLGRGTLG